VDRTGSGLCPVVSFGNSNVDTFGFGTRGLIRKTALRATGC
jgi:hypothetical protein